MNVLVYTGAGTAKGSVDSTLRTLRGLLSSSYDVIPVDAATLIKEPWQQSTSLIVLPGGRDLPYVDSLSPAGTERIRDWVHKGGRYLGICAGAYFGSSRVEFEMGRNGFEVVGGRDLALVSVTAKGSVTERFEYNSDFGAKAVGVEVSPHVAVGTQRLSLYANGGPFFEASGAAGSQAFNILASYQSGVVGNAMGQPAVIEAKHGSGVVTLSGPHIEFSAKVFEGSSEIDPEVLATLRANEEKRIDFLRFLLRRLGVSTNDAAEDSNADPMPSPMYLSYVKDTVTEREVGTWLASLNEKLKDGVLEDTVNAIRIVKHAATVTRPTSPLSVSIVCHEDGRVPDLRQTPQFDMAAYFHYVEQLRSEVLKTRQHNFSFGSILLYGETIGSTQTLLEKNDVFSQQLPVGLTCVGSHQFSGRGRGKNSWVSQQGCLQFSLSLAHYKAESAVFIQYLFALAVVEAVVSKPGYENLPLSIKWPNDIYCSYKGEKGAEFKKLGGILVSSSFSGGRFSLVIGCGINIANSKPTLCVNDVVRQYNETTEGDKLPPISLEETLARILTSFDVIYADFTSGRGQSFAFEPFLERYYRRWLHT
ncbi:biotin holocarboxylase synthetase [Irineochytrium annulatum]|nr:biotin holocarboxylase synthetase [Irineochytrium annulatum]